MQTEVERIQALIDRLRRVVDGQPITPIRAPKGDLLGDLEREVSRLGETMAPYLRDRALFASGPVVLFRWLAKDDWPVESVSPNVLELTGYPAEDFLSGKRSYASLVHPFDLPALVEATELYSKRDISWYAHRPYRILREDGREVWVSNYEMAHRDEQGSVTHYSGYVMDNSEQMSQLERIEEQEKQIIELSSPILKVAHGVLTLPVLGVVTSERAAQMTHDLLTAITTNKARAAILDLTGLGEVDTATLDHLLRMSRSVALLGCKCVMSGLSPEIAALSVRLGFDIGRLDVVATLQDALELVLDRRL